MVVVYPNKKIQIEINEIVVFNESFAREVFIIRRVETFDEASNFLFSFVKTNRTLEKFALGSKSRRGSRGSYEFLSARLTKI